MKKGLSVTKRYCIVSIMAVVLVIAFLLAGLPVNANAETTEITSNEEVYKELTDDDQFAEQRNRKAIELSDRIVVGCVKRGGLTEKLLSQTKKPCYILDDVFRN